MFDLMIESRLLHLREKAYICYFFFSIILSLRVPKRHPHRVQVDVNEIIIVDLWRRQQRIPNVKVNVLFKNRQRRRLRP